VQDIDRAADRDRHRTAFTMAPSRRSGACGAASGSGASPRFRQALRCAALGALGPRRALRASPPLTPLVGLPIQTTLTTLSTTEIGADSAFRGVNRVNRVRRKPYAFTVRSTQYEPRQVRSM